MKREQTRIVPGEKIAWRVVDGEAVILNRDTGWYYSLDKIGTEIWELFTKNKTLEEVMETIAKKYKISLERAKKDISDLLKNLKKENLIKIL